MNMNNFEAKGDNQIKSYYAEYMESYDGKINLVDSDKAYLRLLHTDPDGLTADRESKLCRKYLSTYKGHTYDIRSLKTFPGYSSCLWEEQIIISYPVIRITGSLVRSGCDSFFYKQRKNRLVTIRCEKDDFVIEGVENDIFSAFPFLQSREYLAELINSPSVRQQLISCIRSGRHKGGFGILDKKDSFTDYYTELYPYHTSDNIPHVAITLSRVSNNSSFSGFFGERYNNHMIAGGRLDICKNGHILFSEINSLMAVYLSEGRISRDFIINTELFTDCMKYDSSAIGAVSFHGKDKRYNYILGVCPAEGIGEEKGISVFAVAVCPQEIISRHQINKLSPREANVLRLTAEGHNAAEISEMLNIATSTTKALLSSSYRKMNVSCKTDALMKLFGLF